jgi:sialate O-acetylesterase
MRRMIVAMVILSGVNMVWADVKLPAIFSHNMVLQQEVAAPVWGKADPGEKVTVSGFGQSVSTVADEHGKWRVKLAPMSVDNLPPMTLTVSGKNSITITNVLVGEVWLASGQSNMQMALRNVTNAAAEMAAANYPDVRTFAVRRRGGAPEPIEDFEGEWIVATTGGVERFSAVPYFFGRELREMIKRPIGVINSSYGGTAIEWWMRLESLMTDPQSAKEAQYRIKELADPVWIEAQYAKDQARYDKEVETAKAEGRRPQLGKPQRVGPDAKSRPGGLYNAMIHPLLGYGIRGFLWYQGEHNTYSAEQYARLFPKMIADWRTQWGLGELPFYFVQLPPISGLQNEPMLYHGVTLWAELREAQAKTLSVPKTGMAVTIDTAADGDLHPKDKQVVGNRLARLAAHMVYGKQVACFAPMFKGIAHEGDALRLSFSPADGGQTTIAGADQLRLSFSHADGGLTTKDGAPIQGFAIAGQDRKFVWAEARIVGEQVVVSSPAVKEPVAVRYAWANHPVISLFNKQGLPLAPFRTDDWATTSKDEKKINARTKP